MNAGKRDVDLFVIGAGSGGVRAARIAASYGARVMIAEDYRVGGTCVIRGCVPKKLLVLAARFADAFEDAKGFGWDVSKPGFDWPTLIANKDREIARLEQAYISTLERAKVSLVKARAKLTGPHTVALSTGETVSADKILIATGGWPYYGHAIPGINHVISSNEALQLEKQPARIVIQGGGYIAVEFASIFNGLGSKVTLVYRGEQILRGFDNDLRTHLHSEMTRRGITIRCGHTVTGIAEDGDAFAVSLSNGESLEADKVMFAIGRHPNVNDLGLEQAGVALNKGAIAVDKFSQTSVPHIYAVGDVTDRVALTPVAIREGHAFADTVFGNRPTAVDHNNVPTAVFTQPEVGVIGLTEAQARYQLDRTDIYKTTFRPIWATLAGRETRIFMKLVVDGVSQKVVGCHIVGDAAAEMIQLVGVAITMGATKAQFDATMAVHPSSAEELVTLRERAASYERTVAVEADKHAAE